MKMTNKKNNLKKLTLCAIFVALATVLSFIKIYNLPLGGSITLLSMLPIILISKFLGLKWGLTSAFLYSLIQLGQGVIDGLFAWGLTPLSLIGTIFLDYILAFSVLGLVGITKNKSTFVTVSATALVLIIRFLLHFLSGVIIFDIWCEWDSVWLYSLCYNGSFMLPELIFTVVGVAIIFAIPEINKLKAKIDL